jgi:hypothetical protein
MALGEQNAYRQTLILDRLLFYERFFYFFRFLNRLEITKINPIISSNMLKIKMAIVRFACSFRNKKAIGITTTAANIQNSPVLSRLSIKQIHTKLP